MPGTHVGSTNLDPDSFVVIGQRFEPQIRQVNAGTHLIEMNLGPDSFVVVGKMLIRTETKCNYGRKPVYLSEII